MTDGGVGGGGDRGGFKIQEKHQKVMDSLLRRAFLGAVIAYATHAKRQYSLRSLPIRGGGLVFETQRLQLKTMKTTKNDGLFASGHKGGKVVVF